jgi:two-component system response regulator AtoC
MADTPPHELPPDEVIFGQTPRMQEIHRRIERLACTNIPILICGPGGSGKEVISRLLHQRSPWRASPFLRIDCALTPQTLFSIPQQDERIWSTGHRENVHYGTLFLDEVGQLSATLQARLIRLLQDGNLCRIREREPQHITGRIVCSTTHDLRTQVRAGRFRSDLFYRINVLTIKLPALAERREDVPLLVEYFLGVFSRLYGRSVPAPSMEVVSRLSEHSWPGNIRELENLLREYVLFGSEDVLAAALRRIPDQAQEAAIGNEPVSLKALTREAAKRLERDIMLQVLEANSGNRKKTATKLGISYRSLLYKLKEAGVSREKGTTVRTQAQYENVDALD